MACLLISKPFHTVRAPFAASLLLLLGGGLHSVSARAELTDEIQVYDDSLNAPENFGLELHLNATPSGSGIPDHAGEVTDLHGFRQTWEASYALDAQFELGLYLPFDDTADGQERFAGPKLRLKYIAQHGNAGHPFFYGVNLELSHVKPAFEQSQTALEIRPIFGWRWPDWQISANPVLAEPLLAGHRAGGPEFRPALKLARTVAEGYALGLEYYGEMGKITQLQSFGAQAQEVFLALDVDRGPWVFNLGLGRGLTSEADRWTVKAIIELPIH